MRVGPGVDPDSSAFASPFDHLLHAYVPKDHEIAARQAVYNAAALAALAALCAGAFFASSILEPFLLPILWAVLTGFLLHPHKAAVSLSAKRWLERAAEADRPLLLHCAVSGVSGAVALCDALGSYLMGLWRTLLAVAAVAVALLFMVGPKKIIGLVWFIRSYCQEITLHTQNAGCERLVQHSFSLSPAMR